MKNAISLLLLISFLSTSNSFGQSKSQKLKVQQQKLEKQISNTKKLLTKVKTNTDVSYNQLMLIEKQIQNREELVQIFDNQVRMSEIKILEMNREIIELEQKLKLLVRQYRKMLLYAYKNRNNQAKAIYVLSSNSYNEAIQRNQYLKKIDDIQKRQVALIKQHQVLIKSEIQNIEKEKVLKIQAIDAKKMERAEIEKDKILKESIFKKYKEEENRLSDQLKSDQAKRAQLKKQVDAAIKQEIYEAQKREEERLRKLREKAKKDNTSLENLASEGSIVGKSFSNNQGKLPWPVNNGQITEQYGKNPHPTLKGVTTVNNGIDITCTAGSSARAVFEGTVSSVFDIPGSGMVVLLKHGNYMSVYSNLKNVYVKNGDVVTSKQNIGTLLSKNNFSICHFEIHYISNGLPQTKNPSLWLSR
jgi:septal ring factor EnvC (AmiA/AmiB activator)